jgi:hypothetical protein
VVGEARAARAARVDPVCRGTALRRRSFGRPKRPSVRSVDDRSPHDRQPSQFTLTQRQAPVHHRGIGPRESDGHRGVIWQGEAGAFLGVAAPTVPSAPLDPRRSQSRGLGSSADRRQGAWVLGRSQTRGPGSCPLDRRQRPSRPVGSPCGSIKVGRPRLRPGVRAAVVELGERPSIETQRRGAGPGGPWTGLTIRREC